ncbi:MAG TPA: glyoxalase [Sphingomonas sp.]|nr:glyoxalase [Sphingomonas sp.]
MKTLLPILAVALAIGSPLAAKPLAAKPLPAKTADFAVGPQYDTTHVYVAPEDFDRFVTSFVATFGGTTTKQGVFTVTPTPSKTMSQLVLTPVGTISVFGFKTPVPYPFGAERTGYLVTDLDAATAAARAAGATRLLAVFPDPIGRDVVVQWPGGVNMQIYWHTTAPNYPALKTVPENRVYLTPDAASAFLQAWTRYAHGRILSDNPKADAAEIGRPGQTFRRVVVGSGYGKLALLVSDGLLPWPYGRDMTGYEVADLAATLDKAKAAGAEVLAGPTSANGRQTAVLRFPGGYIAEVHALR